MKVISSVAMMMMMMMQARQNMLKHFESFQHERTMEKNKRIL